MPDPAPTTPLLSAIRDLLGWLRTEDVKGLIIGGVAASLLGRPRTTRDVDVVIWLPDDALEPFHKSSTAHGFSPRLEDSLEFARQSRVLLLCHEASGIDVDVALGALSFEKEAIDNARMVDVKGVILPLPRPEDLLIMKAVAHRPRDLIDAEAILDSHPKLDRGRVLTVVREFAAAIGAPEVVGDLEEILRRIPEPD